MTSLGFKQKFDKDVSGAIAKFLVKIPIKLKDWIPQDKIDWKSLCQNEHPEISFFLKQNQDKIDWFNLSSNSSPSAIELLKQNQDKIDW